MRRAARRPGWRRRLEAALLALWLLPGSAAAATGPRAADKRPVAVPDVPYLPQPQALCGGAVLAMVLRYWGAPDVRPEHFASALAPDGGGIAAESLHRLAEERGYRAFAVRGTPEDAARHLEKGRPLITLVAREGRGHYAVLLAWRNGRLLLHDPALGPFRVAREEEWLRSWNAAGNWALLVLPPSVSGAVERPPADSAARAESTCHGLVQSAIDLAVDEPVAARERLEAAALACPDSAVPPRELAALEFRRENWPAAAGLAEEAVERDRHDLHAWRLLATSRFLAGMPEQALEAWNRIGEPALDLVRIDGLDRTPYQAAYEYLAERSGQRLTPAGFRRARRRLAALPAAQASRIGYRPLASGRAQLEATIVERPALEGPRSVLLGSAVRAASERALGVDMLALTSAGETIRLHGQWQRGRRSASLAATAPRALRLPGIVSAEALWDDQAYALTPRAGAAVQERRRRAALTAGDWWTADLRAGLSVAFDEWKGRGGHLSLAGDIDRRLLDDRVSLRGGAAGWWSAGSGPFHVVSGRISARTSAAEPEGLLLRGDVSYDAASARAPFALWPGAGTGAGRSPLLRGHPLLRDGLIVVDRAFGPRLLRGGLEMEVPLASIGPLRLRTAAFVDWARVLATRHAPAARAFGGVGVGLRLRLPGSAQALRADIATPWGAARLRLSAGWQARWPS